MTESRIHVALKTVLGSIRIVPLSTEETSKSCVLFLGSLYFQGIGSDPKFCWIQIQIYIYIFSPDSNYVFKHISLNIRKLALKASSGLAMR